MQNTTHSKLDMYLAVKAVCDAKPSVWRRSESFADAFTDFCACIENILRLQQTGRTDHATAAGFLVESQVADTILSTEMDELIQPFEAVDVAFVDDYTAARSLDIAEANWPPLPTSPVAAIIAPRPSDAKLV